MIKLTEYLKMRENGETPFKFPEKQKCSIDECDHPATHNSVKGRVCEDCYFDQLGDEIETHPIGRI